MPITARPGPPVPTDMQPLDPERDIAEGREPAVMRRRVEIVGPDETELEAYRRQHAVAPSLKERLAGQFNGACEVLRARDPKLHDELAPLLNVVAVIVNRARFD